MNRELVFKDINDILWNDFIKDENFFNKYRSIENYAIENNLTGVIYEYVFPDKNESRLIITSEYDGIHMDLFTPDKTYKMGYEKTPRQLYDDGTAIRETMIKYSLLYAPKVTNDFITELNQIQENEIVDFNTRLSVICLKNTETELVFKKQFEGKLDSLKINDFRHLDTITINKEDRNDYQVLFNNAYNYRSSTCDIRRRFQSNDGYDILKDIESKLKEDDVVSKDIGPIHLKAAKQDNEIIWFDTDNQVLDRNEVATLFSWAKNSNVDYNVVNLEDGLQRLSPERQNQVNITFLQEIKQASNDLEEMIEIAFYYNNILSHSSISISGLKEDNSHNFDSCTFVFTQGKIIKIDYFDGSFNIKNIKSIGEVSRDEFISFMEKKRINVIKELNKECKLGYEEFQRMHPHFTKEEANDIVQRTVSKKIESQTNPYGFTKEKINKLDNITKKIVNDYIKTKDTYNFSLKELLQENEDNDYDKELS